jgi:hypothetical protein
LVERRPEKAGVASSILAPGTIGMRQVFFSKEIYFAMSEIRSSSVLVGSPTRLTHSIPGFVPPQAHFLFSKYIAAGI